MSTLRGSDGTCNAYLLAKSHAAMQDSCGVLGAFAALQTRQIS